MRTHFRTTVGEIDGRRLTAREQEIVDLVIRALSNREIAERLAVSEHTVKAQLTRLYAKVGVRSRLALTLKVLKR